MAEVEEFSSREIAEWWAFASIEPFGEERADLRAGIIASVMAAPYRDRKKRPEPYTPLDFMPFAPKETPDQALSARLRAAFSGFKRKKKA